MNRFDTKLSEAGVAELRAGRVTTLQVNLGKLCNQACRHCHVDASPAQTGTDVNMQADVAAAIINLLETERIDLLDLTGGAPEMNPHFRPLVECARQHGTRVMDRCNLSILFEPGQQDLARFLRDQGVEITASLPHYRKGPTDRQRGAGVHEKSIEGMKVLNGHGFGTGEHTLNLVYNPAGAFLPGDQAQLEADFKHELDRLFGVQFDNLFCITNMPIKRYLDWLERSDQVESYFEALLGAFNPGAVAGVMCRDLISVGPDGTIYDCDFNQMLELPVTDGVPRNVKDLALRQLDERVIVTGDHCLGCTAGAGSSCGGQLVEEA